MNDKELKGVTRTDNPFSVPEGYFENFGRELMAKLPERPACTIATQATASRWHRLRPWCVAAAMCAGIIFAGAKYWMHSSGVHAASADNQQSYSEEYIEDAIMNSRADDYSVYCYLNNSNDNGI